MQSRAEMQGFPRGRFSNAQRTRGRRSGLGGTTLTRERALGPELALLFLGLMNQTLAPGRRIHPGIFRLDSRVFGFIQQPSLHHNLA